MEFARVSSLKGHKVKIFEKEKELGGQINLITQVKSREEFGEVRRFREVMLKKQGVEIVYGKEVDSRTILGENADAVVLAMGSRPTVPFPFAGCDHKNVLNHEDVLTKRKPFGKRVVILGEDAFRKPTDVAEYCMANGAEYVEIVTKFAFVGLEIDWFNLPTVYEKTLLFRSEVHPEFNHYRIRREECEGEERVFRQGRDHRGSGYGRDCFVEQGK